MRAQSLRSMALSSGLALILGAAPARAVFDQAGQCVGDAGGDGQVTVDEVVQAVNNSLQDCGYEPVTIRFRGTVGDAAFACGQSYDHVGTSHAMLTPSDFRFYVSNLRLVRADGQEVRVLLDQDGTWQLDDIALLDFEDKSPPCSSGTTLTNDRVRGRVAPGDYHGIRFTLGVPFSRNHDDVSVAPSPLSLTGLFWSWQDGYKFIRIDTAVDDFRVHVGSTGCFYARPGVVAGCARPNRGEIFLPTFRAATDVIVADLGALLSDSDLSVNDPNTPPGCMAGPDDAECAPVLRNLGIDPGNGLPTAGTQKMFRVVAGAE